MTPRTSRSAAILLIFPAAIMTVAAQQFTFILNQALPDGKDLQVNLEVHDGKVSHGFARAPSYNKHYYDVSVRRLNITSSSFEGELTLSIPSDGWVPPRGTSLECRFSLIAKLAGGVTGSYQGRTGERQCRGMITGAVDTGPRRGLLTFRIDRCIYDRPDGKKRRRLNGGLRLEAAKITGLHLWPQGSIVDINHMIRLRRHSLALNDNCVTGSIEADVIPNGGKAPVRHVFTWNARIIGAACAGTIKVTVAGKPRVETFVVGDLQAVHLDQQNCIHHLTLYDVPRPGACMWLKFRLENGRPVHGFATTPNFNNATHDLDLSRIRLDGKRLRGAIKVVIQPDPWIPPDHQPIACELNLDATLDAGVVSGAYAGNAGNAAVKGRLEGYLRPPTMPTAIRRATIKLEDALVGGKPYFNRAFVSVRFADGKLVRGNVSNNHTRLKGSVPLARLQLNGDRVTGELELSIEPGGGVTPGIYRVTVDLRLVGTLGTGSFKTRREGRQVKTGSAWIALQ